ncbi:MAG: AAA family ATPase [Candidatus Methanospirareceae archaeon]
MAMIKRLRIKNFKSIKHLELDCGAVNVFIGEPNAGKSNILEALGLLSHGYYSRFAPLRSFIRFESLDDLFYDRILDKDVEVEVECSNGESKGLRISYGDLRFTCRSIENSVLVFNYDFQGEGSTYPSGKLGSFKFYRFVAKSKFERPESGFLLPPNGDNLFSLLIGSKDLKSLVSQILDRFELKLVFNRVEKKLELLKQYEDTYILFPYSLMSETLQRIIFYLVAIKSNKDSVLVFEEPEAHAFPFYTKYLAERIAMDKNNQYFISTHNPYLLNSIIEKAEDVKVFLTYIENYQTMVKSLDKRELEKMLDLDLDVFFNIRGFL